MDLPPGKAGVRETLKIMQKLVREGKKNALVRQTALDLTNGFRQKDWTAEISALHTFVRDRIRYIRDIKGVETLCTAEQLLTQEQGDCDDKSVLLASMLESIGHPTRFVAVGFQPNVFSHVFVETKIGNKWIPLEAADYREMGWRPPNIANAMVIYN